MAICRTASAAIGVGLILFGCSRGRTGNHATGSHDDARTVVVASDARSTDGDDTSPCPEEMVYVPGGTFAMGSTLEGGREDEHARTKEGTRGQRDVTLSPYCIDRTEVTAAAYAACASCEPAATATDWDLSSRGALCNGGRTDRGDHPVNCVTWEQANAYCTSVGKLLPTEAQWEYAARSTDGRIYPWGDTEPSASRLNACDDACRALGKRLMVEWQVMFESSDGFAATAPVATFSSGASPFGALDMSGNVDEWVADWWGSYEAGVFVDPLGPPAPPGPIESAQHRTKVVRGGGWRAALPGMVRATRRIGLTSTAPMVDVGFRCARAE